MKQDARQTRSFIWRKRLIIIAVVAVVSTVLLVVFLSPSPSAAIQARLDAIRRAGQPVTAEELDKLCPPLPASENSATIYSNAFTKLAALPANATGWPAFDAPLEDFRTKPLPPALKSEITAYLTNNLEAMELLHQGAVRSNGYYSTGLRDGFAYMADPPMFELREAAQLLALDAILYADEKRPDLAARCINDMLGLPRSLRQNPFLASQMIRCACIRLTCDTLEVAINKTAFSDAQLDSLSQSFRAADPSDGLRLGLLTERCEAIEFFESLRGNSDIQNIHRVPLKARIQDLWTRMRYYRPSDYIYYLEGMEKRFTSMGQPFPHRWVRIETAGSEAQREESNHKWASFFLTNWDKAFSSYTETFARLALCEAALAVERHRLAHQNQLPDGLQDLVPAFLPAVPADPFDGQPLRYRKLPKGFVIYSVGVDGVDNGGKEPPSSVPATNSAGYDITFTVER